MRLPDPDLVDATTEHGEEVLLFIYTLPCGCRTTERPRRSPWAYRPQLHWYARAWLPVGLGGDEWCRRTLVLGWPFTGLLIVPLRFCRGCGHCGRRWLNGSNSRF